MKVKMKVKMKMKMREDPAKEAGKKSKKQVVEEVEEEVPMEDEDEFESGAENEEEDEDQEEDEDEDDEDQDGDDMDDEEEDEDQEDEEGDFDDEEPEEGEDSEEEQEEEEEEEEEEAPKEKKKKKKKKKVVKPLSKEQLKEFQEEKDRTGMVYLSRIPPYMKPQKVRHLLAQYGEIDRIYLAPEDAKIRAKRKKLGGNTKKMYTEGWVEFKDKKVAKSVAVTLNGKNIGGKKSSFYHDDIWTIKYLPKFKWHHLTERVAYEKAVKEQKLRAELALAKRENNIFLKNVERSKIIKEIQERKQKKAQKEMSQEDREAKEKKIDAFQAIRNRFKQRKVIEAEEREMAPSVISKLFATGGGSGAAATTTNPRKR